MRVAVYYRVSTKAQGDDDRYGLPKQQADVQAYLERSGHEIVAKFEDVGYSGATAERPSLAAMLEAEGFEAVIVPAWDRLARDTTLDGYLRYAFEKRGVAVLSATQENGIDPMAKLTRGILAAVAGYERHLISQRLAGARKVKAARGGYAHGQPPYGTSAHGGGVLAINPGEYVVLERIIAMRAEGLTLRAIAAALDADGLSPRTGKWWGPSSVLGALRSATRVQVLAAGGNAEQRFASRMTGRQG